MDKFILKKIPIGYSISIFLFFILQTWTILNYPPFGIHSWAQADRASIALNYSQDSMNFFYPRVHRTHAGEGITGTEFPFVNWVVAIMYKLFGYHHIFYRGFMLALSCLALSFLLAILIQETNQPIICMVFLLFLSSSPVYLYYASNFIPDNASISLYLIGLCFIYWYANHGGLSHLWGGVICFILAGLIKISALIAIIPLWCSMILSYKGQGKKPIYYVLLFSIIVVTIGAWYGYSIYLNQKYHAWYFTMTFHPAHSLGEMKAILLTTLQRWSQHYFHLIQGITLLIIGLLGVRHLLVKSPASIFMNSYFVLAVLYFILMGKQFVDHDYYFIVIYPLFWVFQLWVIVKWFHKKRAVSTKIKIVILAICSLGILMGWYDGIYARYYGKYKNMHLNLAGIYVGAEKYLEQVGVTYDKKVMVGPDPTTQLSLYLINRKGWQFGDDITTSEFIKMANTGPEYIVCISRLFEKRPGIVDFLEGKKIGNYKEINLYKINYGQK